LCSEAAPFHIEIVDQAGCAGLVQNCRDEISGKGEYVNDLKKCKEKIKYIECLLCSCDVHAGQHKIVAQEMRLQEFGKTKRSTFCFHAVCMNHSMVAERTGTVIAFSIAIIYVKRKSRIFSPGSHKQKLY
jgi:hypothetical protein